ncbi:Putative NADH dehydrogenase/NAD(P)H nitroreductase PMI06_04062 (fragment) [Paraburkholderia piptadeniae]|uniref:NADH dehydrogenase/NAD(P)H nitroreductase PMI06_04062 n=1 Tax=Paraburkholderia piptadeniae TaxID=1701573 RepID=A0A1N7SUX2_9BURK
MTQKSTKSFLGAGKIGCGAEQEFFPEGHVKSNFANRLRSVAVRAAPQWEVNRLVWTPGH